jgi:uncharacterized protein (TIGR00255 family)
MITSMTGFGHGTYSENGLTTTTEIRSVNSRYTEYSIKLPKMISNHENAIKDLMREKIGRGKINIFISFNSEFEDKVSLKINESAAKKYHKLLKDLKRVTKIKEPIKLNHLTSFSEIFEPIDDITDNSFAWSVALNSINLALDNLIKMRDDEGRFLQADLEKRIGILENKITEIEEMAKSRVPVEKQKLMERVKQLIEGYELDENRIETEIALIADKMDITEECVRFRSHNKFFIQCIKSSEQSGRKLNFLIQEMNREINTMGAKANSSEISHTVVEVKEELEKIREQLQNIE